ncbi:MAG: FtsQ-type POTRA domain-containing protein [Firmicutes bacterium]|nr:FtsQ-type POTRA domain-containing protein [Bacillota bacterium]
MATVKVKRKKLRIGIVFLVLIMLSLFAYLGYYLFENTIDDRIKNIYVIGNKYTKDYEIIELAKINNYPRFLSISSNEMERRIKTNPFIKEVDVKKKFGNQIYIYITEYNPLFYDRNNQKLILETNKDLVVEKMIDDIPTLINPVTDESVYKNLITKFIKINDEVKQKISEINYIPNEVDKERFLFSMKDGNYVYITLTKIEEVNKYLDVLSTLNNKKGVLYLDSGNYFEILN